MERQERNEGTHNMDKFAMTGQDYKHGQDSNRTGVLQHMLPVNIGMDKTTMTGQLRQGILDRIFGIIARFDSILAFSSETQP